MLYRLFKILFSLAVKGYFRSIYVKGLEHVPQKGPVIFAANHTSAFMDPILLGVYLPRVLHFLARGDVFNKKLAAWFFSMLNMLPIYRKDESPDDFHKNAEIFQKCFDHLKNSKTILIFPEGLSVTERRLRPFKTGTARIALGAEDQNNFDLDIKIVPIGINYSNPHYFRSDVFVKIGRPITIKEYKDKYKENERETVVELTDQIKTALEKLVVIIEDERLDKLIKELEILYRSKLREEAVPADKAPQDFYLSRDIVRAVEYHMRQNPQRVENFETKLDSYLYTLKRLKIRDTQVRSKRVSLNAIASIFYFTLGFPIFLYGFITNYLPFKTAEFVVQKIDIREDFVGSIKLAGGMFIFLFMYIFEGFVVGTFINALWALIFVLTLYPSGLFTVAYIKNYYQTRGILQFIKLFMRKSDLVTQLKVTRQELIDEIEEARAEFDAFDLENNPQSSTK